MDIAELKNSIMYQVTNKKIDTIEDVTKLILNIKDLTQDDVLSLIKDIACYGIELKKLTRQNVRDMISKDLTVTINTIYKIEEINNGKYEPAELSKLDKLIDELTDIVIYFITYNRKNNIEIKKKLSGD